MVATDPSIDGWPARLGAPRPELEVHQVDVRDPARIEAAVVAAGEVDLLVNNAGYALFATQEEGELAAVQAMFDVNVFGVIRVTQALLPVLRRTRGTIVQLSSVAGRTSFPESGFYAATKHAVEGLSEALAQEVCPFGVRVRVVEPGSFATQFLPRAAELSPEPPADSPYAELREGWAERRQEVLEPPQDPELVVQAILDSLADPAPIRHVIVGPDAERMLGLREALGPEAWRRLAVDRSAPHPVPPSAHEVPTPEQLLALESGDPGFLRARVALEHGHLAHWSQTETGRKALAKLASFG